MFFSALRAGWEDPSAGLPPLEIVSAKTMGTDENKPTIYRDSLGRIFVGSHSLLVFDGQNWSSHAKPGDYTITSLAAGADGILWAGITNDLGFFREYPLGEFAFHSLLDKLPESERKLGTIWGTAPVGPYVYFVGKDKLLRWDGHAFQITSFPSSLRLGPLSLGDERWLQHLETGLYQLTENGPELKFTANVLPSFLIIALFRDETGIVTVSNGGFAHVGDPTPFSTPQLNDYLGKNRVTSFTELPDGRVAIGTVFGGLVLATRRGEIIRILPDPGSGLPGRSVLSLLSERSGEVVGSTSTDLFHFPSSGSVTIFNSLNGLRSGVINGLASARSTLYAVTEDGSYRLVASDDGHARFTAIPDLAARYHYVSPFEDGLLLARFGGVDWFDGATMRPAYEIDANTAYLIVPARMARNTVYVAEVGGIARLMQRADGTFERIRFLELPDSVLNLHEDSTGRLWIGTINKGAFCFDPTNRQLTPVTDPATGKPMEGRVEIAGDEQRMLFFSKNRILQADTEGRGLRPIANLPAITSSVVYPLPGKEGFLVAYQRTAVISGPLHGAGIISFAADGTAAWRELDLPNLGTIGSIRTIAVTGEETHRVLWLGGMEGILRLDFDRIPTMRPPSTPLIKVADTSHSSAADEGILQYPFHNHQVRFRVFTGSYLESKDWLFQSRLDSETTARAWSAPLARRVFDFTDLSEGDYRFEVRAVNLAGMVSPATVFTFRVLPPWYRSGRAYAGYSVALVLIVIGFIRVRERRIRARNQELETLVGIRTAELVKANAAKDEFLAGISHEIRNPMNGVIGIAENFRTDGLDGESRRKFSLLRQCASHLSSLLEDILDFSKVQAGAIELDPKPFDLPELVESVAGITRADSEKYGIPVEVAISPAVPRKLVGDGRRIRQILINFVSNALKFSGRGQVSVTVWCKEAGPGRSEVIFAVSDEGPGISPEEQARLFTRFERGAAAQKGRVPGTGLGLALCKGLAEKMNGKIWLESELGRGSCFYFSAPFPVIESAGDTSPAAAPTTASAGRHALVVDDQEYNRIVLTDLLQSMGFNVHSAQEGQAALNAAAGQVFDVVFLDFNLPGLSGVDVARGIRALPGPSAHALILATTAFTTPEKRAQCLDAGMDAFLGKPVTRERLTKALAGLAPAAAPTQAAATAALQPVAKKPAPADPLGNLRLLARKKGVTLADELAAYFTDLDAEFANLNASLEAENADEAGRFSHMICGRCSFIYERDLEQVQRKVEAAIADLQWAEARRHAGEFAQLLAERRVKLASSDPAAPPA